MTVGEWIGVAAGVVAILGAMAAVTRYLIEAQYKVRQEKMEGEIKQAQERYAELELRHKELLQIVASARTVGTAALVKKTELDAELSAAMETLQASASSILVPDPSPGSANFVFLSIFGPAAANLRRSRVPLNKGIAGYVFSQNTPYVSLNAAKDNKFFSGVDRLSSFQTMDVLCVPLRQDAKVIGVMQFLNKRAGGAFDQDDLRIAERFAASLSNKTADFVRNPDNFELLGITPERTAREATVLFCDITASSLLFGSMNASVVIDLINDYLERQSSIALDYGATVDKYLGDGAMLRFNVPRPVGDHSYKAVQAALDMQRDFDKLKESWTNYGLPARSVFSRVGLAAGPVYEAIIGHPQYKNITVMGDPVNLAGNLCEYAERGRSLILIDERIHADLAGRIEDKPAPIQVKEGSVGAYEVVSLK